MSAWQHRELAVFIGNERCGTLNEANTGALAFEYLPGYEGVPLSLSMPVALSKYGDRVVRPYLMGLLPDEETTRAAIGAKYGVSGDNPFRLLAHIGNDCPGAVRVIDEGENGAASRRSPELTELSDSEIATILAEIRESAPAAWAGQGDLAGHWSLGGCQAKTTLCRLDGRWHACEGAAPSTHILKPGVAGMNNQALVEYLSTHVADSIGLPTAGVSFERFDDEWAIVVERFDRFRGANGIERLHQEDFCQALGVSPLRKYAEQGGPNALQVMELLKGTGDRARSNVHRFALYLFFNYLIGATDAHAKNYSLVLFSADDVRLAPLYDVASIAPYRSLGPKRRKPLRAAMSIGGENRFGCVGAEHVEKMVDNCGLEELGLGAGVLVRQFRAMAEAIPAALASEVERAADEGLPGIDAIRKPMEKEIGDNCHRSLSLLS